MEILGLDNEVIINKAKCQKLNITTNKDVKIHLLDIGEDSIIKTLTKLHITIDKGFKKNIFHKNL